MTSRQVDQVFDLLRLEIQELRLDASKARIERDDALLDRDKIRRGLGRMPYPVIEQQRGESWQCSWCNASSADLPSMVHDPDCLIIWRLPELT